MFKKNVLNKIKKIHTINQGFRISSARVDTFLLYNLYLRLKQGQKSRTNE